MLKREEGRLFLCKSNARPRFRDTIRARRSRRYTDTYFFRISPEERSLSVAIRPLKLSGSTFPVASSFRRPHPRPSSALVPSSTFESPKPLSPASLPFRESPFRMLSVPVETFAASAFFSSGSSRSCHR